MQTLTIKDGYRKVYTIDETGITIRHYKNSKLPTEEIYQFENIKREKLFFVNRSPLYLIFGGGGLLLSVMPFTDDTSPKPHVDYLFLTVWVTLSLCCALCYFILPRKLYYLKTFKEKFIRFRIKNNETDISAFIEEVLKKRDAYLKMKYGVPNPLLSYDHQYSNFNILLSEKIFSPDEYNNKVNDLNQLFNQTKPGQVYHAFTEN